MSLKLAVLASGSGTNFQAMVDAVRRGALDADIRLVICNRPGAKVIERAKAAGIICAVMDHKLWPSREAYDLAVADAILKSGADTVALAGYMRMLTAGFLNAFPHRVVNVHPALLPSFPGIHGAADAQAWGVKITGCTVHLVDEIMDHGEVIIQAAVPAIAGEPLDDLQSRIHAQEHRIYPQALQWLAENRIKMDGSVFTASSTIADWFSRSLADELGRQGVQVSFASTLEQARAANPTYIVTGTITDVWLQEQSTTRVQCTIKAKVALSNKKGVLYSENLSSTQERQFIPSASAIESLLSDTLKDLLVPAAKKIQSQIH